MFVQRRLKIMRLLSDGIVVVASFGHRLRQKMSTVSSQQQAHRKIGSIRSKDILNSTVRSGRPRERAERPLSLKLITFAGVPGFFRRWNTDPARNRVFWIIHKTASRLPGSLHTTLIGINGKRRSTFDSLQCSGGFAADKFSNVHELLAGDS